MEKKKDPPQNGESFSCYDAWLLWLVVIMAMVVMAEVVMAEVVMAEVVMPVAAMARCQPIGGGVDRRRARPARLREWS